MATDMTVNVVGQKLLAYSIVPKSDLVKFASKEGFLSNSTRAKHVSKLELIELIDERFWSTCAFLKLLENGLPRTVIAGYTRSVFLMGHGISPNNLVSVLGMPSSLNELPLCFVKRHSYFGKIDLAPAGANTFSINTTIRRRHCKVKLFRNGILQIELSRGKSLNLIPLSTTEGLKLYNRVAYPYLIALGSKVGGIGIVPSTENSLGIARYQPVCIVLIAPTFLERFGELLYEIRIYANRRIQKQLKQLHRIIASIVNSKLRNNVKIGTLSDVVQSNLNMREVSRHIYRYFTDLGFSTSFVSLRDINYILLIYKSMIVGPVPRPLGTDKLRESIDEISSKIAKGKADDIFMNYDVTYIKFLLEVEKKHEEMLSSVVDTVKRDATRSPYYLSALYYEILKSARFLGIAPRSLRIDAYSNMTESAYMQMLNGVLLPTMSLLIKSEKEVSEEIENVEGVEVSGVTKVAKTAAGE